MSESPNRAGPTLLSAANTPQQIVTGTSPNWPILREIIVVNETTGDVAITVGINTSSTDVAGKRITPPALVLHAGETFEWAGFLPLKGSTEQLYAQCSVANGATITVGYVDGP